MVKVHMHLHAALQEGKKARKYWCRMGGSNSRPSVYKTAGPYPITPVFAGFLISPFRSSARSRVRESAIRCKSHLRAVVAFFFAKRRPQTRLLPRRGLAHDEGSIA